MSRTVDLTILAACAGLALVVAVPRQAQLASEQRRAEVTALGRNAATALGLAHAQWQAAREPATIPGIRGLVAMANGYPSVGSLPLLLAEAEVASFVYENGLWRHASVDRTRRCGVAYQSPAGPGLLPAVLPLTADC